MVYPHFTDKETKAHGRDLPMVASVCVSLGPSASPTHLSIFPHPMLA